MGEEGPVLAAYSWKTNGHLIEAVATRLGYLRADWPTIDPTFGRGKWWTRWKPDVLVTHDLIVDGVDFRELPEESRSMRAAAFDPAYVCVSLDTEILTRRGWLLHSEVRVDDEALTFNRSTGMAEWQPIDEVNIYPAGPHLVSIEGKSHSSLTTPNHRWPTRGKRPVGTWRWRTSESFGADDVVPVAASVEGLPSDPKWSDALVEVVAWFWTEGHIDRLRSGGPGGYCNITQAFAATDRCDRIRAALRGLMGPQVDRFPRTGRTTDGVPRWRETLSDHKAVFWLSADAGRIVQEHAPGRVPTHEFLLSLTKAQILLFIDTSLAADGHTRIHHGGLVRTLGQKNREAAEAFQFAAILAGIPTSIHPVKGNGYPMWVVRLRAQSNFKPRHNRITWVACSAEDVVWCPRTRNETWLARRNGTVYFTGNCVGGRETSTMAEFNDRYGLRDAPRTPAALQRHNDDGLAEVHRVLEHRGIALVKCADYIWSGRLVEGTLNTRAAAGKLGFEVIDRLEHVGHVRAQPGNRTRKHPACRGVGCDGCVEGRVPSGQHHARRNLSTLFVLRKRSR